MTDFTEEKARWKKINKPIGKRLGYPPCCIEEFCNQPPELLRISKPSEIDKIRYKAGCINGKFTGFIPCSYHAKEIKQGNITLASLIQNRDVYLPSFPNV